ncbi:MAG TPA: hypothetical protein PKE31_00370 [Pseudomonadota bacterium]|nr:hypothetical protein [Pseudomonadota bacterium]
MGHAHLGSGSGPGVGARTRNETRERAVAVVVERNRNTAKRLARVLVSAGYTVKTYEDENTAIAPILHSDSQVGLWFVVGEMAASEAIAEGLKSAPSGKRCAGLVYGAQEDTDLARLFEQPAIVAVLGAKPASARPDLEGDLLNVAALLRGQPLLPVQGFLLWGAQAFSASVTNIGGRDAAEARLVKLCSEHLTISRRVADSLAEVVHELITNAMYDAPVDAQGRTRYAHDRTAHIELPAEDKVIFRYGTDGLRLAVEVVDRFGRLKRSDLVRSLRRAQSGQVNRGEGGAGIGLSLICRTCPLVQIDVEPGVRTRLTAVVDLEPGRTTEGPKPGRSVIFPDLTVFAVKPDTLR